MIAATRPTLADVEAAAAAIAGVARRTPVVADDLLDDAVGSSVQVKAEFLQRGGAYKFRGIFNRVRQLDEDEKRAGIVTLSSGNAGIAAAYAARLCATSCTVVMPVEPAAHKAAAIQALGAKIVAGGSSSIAMAARACELAAEGQILVHPFDDPEVIAGQGTIAVELTEELDPVDALLVPAAGGGMLAGVAIVLSELENDLELVAVQPESADSLRRSLAAGKPVEVSAIDTLADGLAVARCGDLNFELIRRRVDDVLLVSDDDILRAIALYWRALHVAVEPAGAATLAALIRHPRFHGKRVAIIASGANIDGSLLRHAIAGGTAKEWEAAAR
jgi:threonine dehydratase